MAPGVRGTGLVATVGSAHRLQPPPRRVVTDSRTISLAAFTIPPAIKEAQGRLAHHFPVTALTSAFTASDLPSATAPCSGRSAVRSHEPTGTRRHRPGRFSGYGHPDGSDGAQAAKSPKYLRQYGKSGHLRILRRKLRQCRKNEVDDGSGIKHPVRLLSV